MPNPTESSLTQNTGKQINWCSITYNMNNLKGSDATKAFHNIFQEACIGKIEDGSPDVVSIKTQEGSLDKETINNMEEWGYKVFSKGIVSLAGNKYTSVCNYLFVHEKYNFKEKAQYSTKTKLGKGILTIEGDICDKIHNLILSVRSSGMHLESASYKTREENEQEFLEHIDPYYLSDEKDLDIHRKIYEHDVAQYKCFDEIGGDGNKRLLMKADCNEKEGTRVNQDAISAMTVYGFDFNLPLENSEEYPTTYQKPELKEPNYYTESSNKSRKHEQTGGHIDKLAYMSGCQVESGDYNACSLKGLLNSAKEPSDHLPVFRKYKIDLSEKPDHFYVIEAYKRKMPDITTELKELRKAIAIAEYFEYNNLDLKDASIDVPAEFNPNQLKFRDDKSNPLEILQKIANVKSSDLHTIVNALDARLRNKIFVSKAIDDKMQRLNILQKKESITNSEMNEIVKIKQYFDNYNQLRKKAFSQLVLKDMKETIGKDPTFDFESPLKTLKRQKRQKVLFSAGLKDKPIIDSKKTEKPEKLKRQAGRKNLLLSNHKPEPDKKDTLSSDSPEKSRFKRKIPKI